MNYTKKDILFIFLMVLIVIMVSYITLSDVLSTKHVNMKFISKFNMQELTKNTNHKVLDGYAISFALSDSLIYITDTNDTTTTRSYCYDYRGNRKDGFHFPEKTGYWENFAESSLYYLPQSRMLVYNDFDKHKLDYYNLNGKLIKNDNPLKGKYEAVLSIAEYRGGKYFIAISAFINKPKLKDKINSHICLYKEMHDKMLKIVKSIEINKKTAKNNIFFKLLQIDDNINGTIATFEEKKSMRRFKIYKPDKTIVFYVWKRRNNFGKTGPSDIPIQFKLGENYIVLGTWLPRIEYPLEQKVYNFKGRFIGKLEFEDDNRNELVDIVGDRLVAFNPATSAISIYQIKVR